MESLFPPGMRTRVHSHSGPEAFYVIDGEQCTATPAGERRTRVGESTVVTAGAHLQAAPRGRRSMVMILETAANRGCVSPNRGQTQRRAGAEPQAASSTCASASWRAIHSSTTGAILVRHLEPLKIP